MAKARAGEVLCIGGREIAPGESVTVQLPVPQLYTQTPLSMPVHVIRGRKDGPRLFVSAVIHGDELNGVEIIRRLMKLPVLKRLRGTLITIPIVNIYGVIHHSRYLPDRRDLNRSFPGSEKGSMAARLAHLFMREIVANSTHGIDLHTGAIHRENLPQVRANLSDAETSDLANVFGVPVLIDANVRDGSLRGAAASESGIPMLLYEAGEGLRFDEISIRAGLSGIRNVMRKLEMLPPSRAKRRSPPKPYVARASSWARAPSSGIFRSLTPLGALVEEGGVLGYVADPFADQQTPMHAGFSGIVIGRSNLPLVHEGDALYHIARFKNAGKVGADLETFQQLQEEWLESSAEAPLV